MCLPRGRGSQTPHFSVATFKTRYDASKGRAHLNACVRLPPTLTPSVSLSFAFLTRKDERASTIAAEVFGEHTIFSPADWEVFRWAAHDRRQPLCNCCGQANFFSFSLGCLAVWLLYGVSCRLVAAPILSLLMVCRETG